MLLSGPISVVPVAEAESFGPNPPRGIHLSYPGDPTTAAITWHTTVLTTSRAEWGTNPGPPFPNGKAGTDYVSPGGTFLHVVTLTGLTPGTRYYYRVGDAPMASWAGGSSFVAAPAAGSTGPFTFAAVGDIGNTSLAQTTASRIAARNPNLVLGLGDYYYAASDSGVRDFYEKMQVFGEKTFFPMAMGNHEHGLPSETEYTSKETHCAFVNLPGNERSFAFKFGNTFFLTLDWGRSESDPADGVDGSGASCGGASGTAAVRAWADTKLAAANLDPEVQWKVVFQHFLCYDTTTPSRVWLCPGKGDPDQMEDIMANRGVDLVVQAHMHNYGRTHPVEFNIPKQRGSVYDAPGAPIYLVIGTGGHEGFLGGCRTDEWVAACRATQITAGFGHFSVTQTAITYEFVENTAVPVDDFVLSKDSTVTTLTFQKGDGGAYGETDDTFLFAGSPNTNYGSTDTLRVDGGGCVDFDEDPQDVCRTLVKFPQFLGPNSGQVPAGSTILQSTLEIDVTSPGQAHNVYQITESWTEGGATWNGFATPGLPANKGLAFSFNPIRIDRISLSVKSLVQNWSSGDANQGLLFTSFHDDGGWYASSESVRAPKLSITFQPPPPPPPPPFDFSLSVNPSSGTVIQGESISAAVTATLVSGQGNTVTFSASGLPTGAFATYSPSQCVPTCQSTMTISTSSNTPTGTFGVTLKASDGSIERTAAYTLVVEPPEDITLTFQQGDGGAYSETDDAFISSAFPLFNYGGDVLLRVDADGCLTDLPLVQEICRSLIKFPNFIGSNSGQVPPGATIVSASLELQVADTGGSQTAFQLAESWSESTVNWLTFLPPGEPDTTGSGYNFEVPSSGTVSLDVTTFVANWVGGAANHGWLVRSSSTDGVQYRSSESSARPKLTVTFQPGANLAPPHVHTGTSHAQGAHDADGTQDWSVAVIPGAGVLAFIFPIVRSRARRRESALQTATFVRGDGSPAESVGVG